MPHTKARERVKIARKGAQALNASLTAKQRRASARKAARVRWAAVRAAA